MGRVRTKHSRCKYGNPLLCWCAEYIERFMGSFHLTAELSLYIECLSTLRCKPIYYKTLS